jgi:proteasome accessory factor C
MSLDASERLRRLLAVFPLFAEREEVTLADLERLSGVDAATLLEDLAAITDRDDEPGGFVASVDASIGTSRVAIRSEHFLRPLRLNVPELCALELGLAMLAGTGAPDEQRAITRARSRIRAAIVKMPTADREEGMWHASAPSAVNEGMLMDLRAALSARHKVRIVYRKAAAEEGAERLVRPYGLIPANDTWYLVGHCESSEAVRFFRLDRVEDVRSTGDSYRIPASISVERLAAPGKPFYSESGGRLTVRYSPRIARWIAERENVPLADDGSLTLEHPLADEDWAVRHVLQYGPEAVVLAPSTVREKIRARLASILT